MIKQAEKDYAPKELEKKIQEFWARTKAYEKVKRLRFKGRDYYFVDGPPYTTGSIHLGTAWNKVIKDCIVRYRRMQNLNVRDQPGFDMHGLPIEVQVERSLGIVNKREIEDLGIEKFVTTCRDFSMDLQKKMSEQFASLGVWLDWNNPYLTVTNNYIEAAWWTLKKAHEKNLLTQSQRVLQWCPRCETALAEAEIEYWDEVDPSIYVKFPLRGRREESILIWTTTPWTLPANLAIMVHPDLPYAKLQIRRAGRTEFLWTIEENVDQILLSAGISEYSIVEKVPGEKLVGLEYFHPLASKVPYQKQITGMWVHKVFASETVTGENTGCVHTAPGHGPEDFEVGMKYGLPAFCPVDERGYFTVAGGDYKGKHVREANYVIVDDLRNFGLLFLEDEIVHRYGHCWRCQTPLIYRTTEQWFLKVTELKSKMLDEIKRIRWIPEWAGSSRQYDWVQNLKDWCISRQRYWGIPLPIWRCSCGEVRVVGLMKELRESENYQEGMDLHRPWIDAITFRCGKCGRSMNRVPDVLDVWFDSGVASWAQLNYPSEEREFKRWWPTKWITEAHDQTRGWFNSQLCAGMIAFGKSPYESVLMHGWMNDAEGRPMSKSLGNVIEPFEVVDKYGVDSLRLYLFKSNAPWEDVNFLMEEVKNANRTLNILWNVYKFAATYMSIDGFEPGANTLESLNMFFKPEDRWLLSRIQKLKILVEEEMEKYNLHRASRELESFILNDLSRWYVKLVRDRVWVESQDKGKIGAYKVLHEALTSVAMLLAPICPHITEEIYQNLDGRLLSVHMCDWPRPVKELLSADLEKRMSLVQEIVEVVSKARQKHKVKLRWPVRKIGIKGASEEINLAVESLKEVLKDQTNSKEVQVLRPGEEWDGMVLEVHPNPQAIGRVYKTWWSKIATMLETRPPEEIKREIDKGEYKIGIEGQLIKIEPSMVSFTKRMPEDVVSIETHLGEIYVDMKITPEIEAEGYAREIIRRVQQMRKEIDLHVEDFVKIGVRTKTILAESLLPWKNFIASETRSRVLKIGDEAVDEEYVVEWDIEGEGVTIGITPLHIKETIDAFMSISGITRDKAMSLFDAGYTTIQSLKQASKDELMAVNRIEEPDASRIKTYLERPEEMIIEEKAQCPVCSASIRPDTKKCWRCEETLVKEVLCPNCNSSLFEGATICESCGFDLTKKEVEEVAREGIRAIARIPGLDVTRAKLLYEAGYTFGKLKEVREEELQRMPGIDRRTIQNLMDFFGRGGERICPLCGARAEMDAKECTRCGTSLLEVKLPLEERGELLRLEKKFIPETLPELKESLTYLVKEERPEYSYSLFIDTTEKGKKGYCVTRVYPAKIREKHNLGEVPILWLSNVGKEDSVRPKDLEKLSLSLEQFISKEGGVVLLDGIEYLITNNNFITVLRLVQSLRDQIAINRATLILSVNPSTLDSHQLHLLEREVDSVLDLTP